MHYVVLDQLLRFCFDREMSLVKVHTAIRFILSPYVAGYLANNTKRRRQYKHDDLINAFYKLMNFAP